MKCFDDFLIECEDKARALKSEDEDFDLEIFVRESTDEMDCESILFMAIGSEKCTDLSFEEVNDYLSGDDKDVCGGKFYLSGFAEACVRVAILQHLQVAEAASNASV